MQEKFGRWAAWAVLALCLGLGAWHSYRFASHSAAALSFVYPLDGLEGTLLSEARLLRAGEPLYQPLRPDRFISAPYQPLSYVALAAAEQLAYGGGPPPADSEAGPIFRPGRALSLMSIVGAGLLAGLAAWRAAGTPLAGLLLVGLWLGFAPVQLWATRIKPDPLALLFTAAGLLIFALSRSKPPQRAQLALALAALCFALAFYTKQTAVAAPAAVGLVLLLDGLRLGADRRLRFELRPALFFALVYLALIGGGWLGLQWLTGGQHAAHVLGLHSTEWWSAGLFYKYAGLLVESAWPLLLALALQLIAWLGAWLRPSLRPTPNTQHPTPSVWLCYALCALAPLVLAGAEGAHHNHLLEPYLALCLAITVRIADRRFLICNLQSAICLALLLGQLLLLTQRPAWYGGEFDLERQARPQFIALIKSQPGEVLADDVALLLAAGRELRYDDPSTMGPAARIGIWDQSNLLREVAEGRFSLILLPFDATKTDTDPTGRWSPEFIAALRERYTLLYRDVIFSYVPK
jgi:hypothetical protein